MSLALRTQASFSRAATRYGSPVTVGATAGIKCFLEDNEQELVKAMAEFRDGARYVKVEALFFFAAADAAAIQNGKTVTTADGTRYTLSRPLPKRLQGTVVYIAAPASRI